jgi:hypothetical protein
VFQPAAELTFPLTVAVHPFKKPFIYAGFDNLNTDGHGEKVEGEKRERKAKKRRAERFDDSVYVGLPSALPPHPSFGHLLPWGEGGGAARPAGSLRLGLLPLVLQAARTDEVVLNPRTTIRNPKEKVTNSNQDLTGKKTVQTGRSHKGGQGTTAIRFGGSRTTRFCLESRGSARDGRAPDAAAPNSTACTPLRGAKVLRVLEVEAG